MIKLFDSAPRTDPSPSRHAESRYSFLNRVCSTFFERVREVCEEWFSHLPEGARMDVRARFQSDDNRQMTGAFWEMYLYASLLRLGFNLITHPRVEGSPGRPDFVAEHERGSFYLEAVVSTDAGQDFAAERRRRRIYDTLDRLESPNFYLWVEVDSEGPTDPPAAKFRSVLEQWLGTLDPDEVTALAEKGGPDVDSLPGKRWTQSGWDITFRAIPKKPEARRTPSARPLGVFSEGGARIIDSSGPIRDALRAKASRYGELDRPYVIAVLCEGSFVREDSLARALFGSEAVRFEIDHAGLSHSQPFRNPDGFWTQPPAPRFTRVSAVLFAINLSPWTIAQCQPSLWHNPWAKRPLEVDLPWKSNRADASAGSMVARVATTPSSDLFGLPDDWPGPEEPFEPD